VYTPLRNENATTEERGVLKLDVPLGGTHPFVFPPFCADSQAAGAASTRSGYRPPITIHR
jgi:hypothetical protein